MDDYTVSNQPDKSVRSKLNTMFSRYNWVGIKNVLGEDFSYPVALEQNEILDMRDGDPMNEEQMSQKVGGTFLPGTSTLRNNSKLVKVNIRSGERRMIMGEAAYVVVPKIFSALVRKRYGATKQGLAKLRNPHVQEELLKEIVVGPIINNVGEAMQTYVNDKIKDLDGFTDVQATAPKGFANPEILAKAKATRDANKQNS